MSVKNISSAILGVGVDDTTIDLFESQYPVPTGVSYNSYVIRDEKIAILDTVDERATDEWLANVTEATARRKGHMMPVHRFSGGVEHALGHIEEVALHDQPEYRQRWYAVKLFERNELVEAELGISKELKAHIEQDIRQCELEYDDDSDGIIAAERYDFVEKVLAKVTKLKKAGDLSASDRIDRVVTNRWLALPIFALIMFAVYYISVCAFVVNLSKPGNFISFFTINTIEILPAGLICNRCRYFPVLSEGHINASFPNPNVFTFFRIKVPVSGFYIESAANRCSYFDLVSIIGFCI